VDSGCWDTLEYVSLAIVELFEIEPIDRPSYFGGTQFPFVPINIFMFWKWGAKAENISLKLKANLRMALELGVWWAKYKARMPGNYEKLVAIKGLGINFLIEFLAAKKPLFTLVHQGMLAVVIPPEPVKWRFMELTAFVDRARHTGIRRWAFGR